MEYLSTHKILECVKEIRYEPIVFIWFSNAYTPLCTNMHTLTYTHTHTNTKHINTNTHSNTQKEEIDTHLGSEEFTLTHTQ